jgi:hypothetical protein
MSEIPLRRSPFSFVRLEGGLALPVCSYPMSVAAEHDRPDDLQIAAWKRMGGRKRVELANRIRHQTIELKRDTLARNHPEWTAAELQQATARYFLHGHV